MAVTGEQEDEGLQMASELIRARADMGYTQAHLAEVSGVSRSAIKAYETGRSVPGSRELRALCQALKVSPNKVIFGVEAPTFEEGDAPRLEAILRADPEGKALARVRLAMLADLLTTDETAALLLLAQSVATARHGAEKVRQQVLGATMQTGFLRFLIDEGAKAMREGRPVDAARLGPFVDDFMTRNGPAPSSREVK